jgi:hypothetical protein
MALAAKLLMQWKALHDKVDTLWRRPEWPARTAWAPSQRHSTHKAVVSAGILLKIALKPCWPLCTTAWRTNACHCTVSVLAPDSSAAWVDDTLPLSTALELKSGEFLATHQNRLDLAILPFNAFTVQCRCEATLHGSDIDHGMQCSALAAQFALRHDIMK